MSKHDHDHGTAKRHDKISYVIMCYVHQGSWKVRINTLIQRLFLFFLLYRKKGTLQKYTGIVPKVMGVLKISVGSDVSKTTTTVFVSGLWNKKRKCDWFSVVKKKKPINPYSSRHILFFRVFIWCFPELWSQHDLAFLESYFLKCQMCFQTAHDIT